MDKNDIVYDELIKALSRLKEALALPKNEIVRDSVIQRFEFTVELSWKLLQKHLKASGISEVLTPKNAIREAARLRIIDSPEKWIHFIDDRNLSSHTYREDLAEKVYASAQELPDYVDKLIYKLKNTNV